MTDLVVRRLLIDLETPVARHWNGGDAFRTAFFNALSFSFPAGEQFFIDSVRRVLTAPSPNCACSLPSRRVPSSARRPRTAASTNASTPTSSARG